MNRWGERQGRMLSSLINEFDKLGIRYFIIRNYEGLPNVNYAKDVDIVVDPSRIRQANDIIVSKFKSEGFTHYSLARFVWLYCWHAMDVNNHQSIHLDLIAGYKMRGYEIYTFEELYKNTSVYNGFKILNGYYEGLMVFIYKQFGYKNPVLKQDYRDVISRTLKEYPQFESDLTAILGEDLAKLEINAIKSNDFNKMVDYSDALTMKLKAFSFKKHPLETSFRIIQFCCEKFKSIVLFRYCHIRAFSVMAPDGAGKTTFLDALIEEIGHYMVTDAGCCHVYHFRPLILPNLGEIGGKTGMMKPDTNFNEPHRAKPARFLSSLLRISYYWLDYVIGWYIKTFRDIQYDRYTVFDRYAYDLIVDPHRTRLNLPRLVRMLYVKLMPEPRFSFYIDVEPEEIYRRKQELQPEEIARQVKEYRRLAKSNKRIITIDGNRNVDEMVKDAIKVVLDNFANRCK